MSQKLLENKQKILRSFLQNAPLNGWDNKALQDAVRDCGFTDDFSNFFDDISSLIEFYVEQQNLVFKNEIKDMDFSALRIRDKITQLVKKRLLIEEKNKNALKALGFKQKSLVFCLLRSNYRIADVIWEVAGDKSDDFSFYSKRLILSKVFSRTLFCFLNDESENYEKSWKFLDGQIAKVMKIQKIKMDLKNCFGKIHNSPAIIKDKINNLPFIRLINRKKR